MDETGAYSKPNWASHFGKNRKSAFLGANDWNEMTSSTRESDQRDVPDPIDNREDALFVERLRSSVEAAGGPTLVARQSGVPLRNLTHYLAGREMKRPSLVAIAKTCGVSVGWLATGDAPREPGAAHAAGAPSSATDSQARTLFATINMDLLAAAMEGANKAARENNVDPTDWRTRAQLTCLLYDAAVKVS